MTLKIHARTNAPRTCLWCGQKLREGRRTERREVSADEWRRLDQLDRGRRWIDAPAVADVAGLSKLRKLRVVRVYRVNPDQPHTDVGERGERFMIDVSIPDERFGVVDGLFCTGACARRFGIAAARNGYRFQPSSPRDL